KNAQQWKTAMDEEISDIISKKVYERVSLSPAMRVLDTKWVFKLKEAGTEFQRFKARVVVRGFRQIEGIDFQETYSPTVDAGTFKLILTIAVNEGHFIKQLDIRTAFLYGILEETIYVHPPKGKEDPGFVWKL